MAVIGWANMVKHKIEVLPYSIRKDGQIYEQSNIPNCDHTPQTLRSMAKAGYCLYQEGKRVRIGSKDNDNGK